MTIYNLSDNRTMEFDKSPLPYKTLKAVCFAWAEDNNRKSLFFKLIQDGADPLQFINNGFPVVIGQHSIACGDWCGKVQV